MTGVPVSAEGPSHPRPWPAVGDRVAWDQGDEDPMPGEVTAVDGRTATVAWDQGDEFRVYIRHLRPLLLAQREVESARPLAEEHGGCHCDAHAGIVTPDPCDDVRLVDAPRPDLNRERFQEVGEPGPVLGGEGSDGNGVRRRSERRRTA